MCPPEAVAGRQASCGAFTTHSLTAYIQAIYNLCLDTCTKAAVQACVPELQAPATCKQPMLGCCNIAELQHCSIAELT